MNPEILKVGSKYFNTFQKMTFEYEGLQLVPCHVFKRSDGAIFKFSDSEIQDELTITEQQEDIFDYIESSHPNRQVDYEHMADQRRTGGRIRYD